MKPKVLITSVLFAIATGLGVGVSGTSVADPGCAGDCFAARYECFADCAGTPNYQQCRTACQIAYETCLAGCG